MKFCKDCKWAHIGTLKWMLHCGSYEFAKCHHPKLAKPALVDPVTGVNKDPDPYWYCASNRLRSRMGPDECSYEGNLWEPSGLKKEDQ